jgi:hypothetical protein
MKLPGTLTTVRTLALAAAAYFALTVVYTWPLPIRLADGVIHDAGDPLLNAWILWWNTQALPLTATWWNAPMFYPAAGTFAFSEHLLGLAPISSPLIALTGNALLGYNVAFFLSYVFCGLGAHFLAYTLTRRHDAALIAGIAFAFAPYRLAQLPHIQVLCAYWIPVCLAALHHYDRKGTTPWAALAAFAWLMQALSNGYYMFFLTVLLALWLMWYAAGRWPALKIARLGGFFVVAGLLLLPVLLGYRHILVDNYALSRDIGTIREFSADIAAVLNATDDLLLWGWLHVFRKAEGELFPGLTLFALAVAAVIAAHPLAAGSETSRNRVWLRRILGGLFVLLFAGALMPLIYGNWRLTIGGVRLVSIARADKPLTLALFALLGWMATLPAVAAAARRRSALLFYAFGAFMMWVFALGPDPTFLSLRALYQAPYGWLMRLPGFDGLRVPARFWMMSLICLSVIAAMMINRLHGRTRTVVTWIAAIGLLLDAWPRSYIVLAAPEPRLAPPGVVARLDLPMDTDHDAAALYYQTFESIPLYNGFSGYGAPHAYAMREMLETYDPRILRVLTARGPLGVVIDHKSDPDGALRKFISTHQGAKQHETHADWSSYVLPQAATIETVPEEKGQRIAIKSLVVFPSQPHAQRATDGNLKTRWSGGVQQVAADFTIEIAEPGRVQQVVVDLGEYVADYPMRLHMEASGDGRAWETVFLGDTVLHAYYAAVRDPKRVPLVLPVERDGVRFIRLKQLGWGKRDWSIPEVHVLR